MASTNFTTHYSIPLPLGTDLTTPMDYNEAAEAVDTALFGAVTDAGNAAEAAGEAVNTANAASAAVEAVSTDLVFEKAKIVQLQTRMTAAENDIDDVYTDVTDMITAYKEPSATSTHAYAIGDYFIYNETLYRATAAIAIGATIVPNTNCETTNVSSELKDVISRLAVKNVSNMFALTGDTDCVLGSISINAFQISDMIIANLFFTAEPAAANQWYNIGTINSAIKPVATSSESYTYLHINGTIQARDNGVITLRADTAGSSIVGVTVMYTI